ncbi:MAG: type II toxin-antitoxin system RelE/ParE family toxin [Candidatus Peribacteraceae bacterium]|nr:type II toxin-antitoxin system RelE/ParE family toxin [Candidatus Peribacteraceae bacterium]
MSFVLTYHAKVVSEDIPSLPKAEKSRIKAAIEKKLTKEPETFGKPLRRSLNGYRRLHVGDYRVIFRIEKRQVIIFLIAHRSVVYRQTTQRIA